MWMGEIIWRSPFLPCYVSPSQKKNQKKQTLEVKGLGRLRNNVSVSAAFCLIVSLSQLCHLNQFR